jgi:hypothetical protein
MAVDDYGVALGTLAERQSCLERRVCSHFIRKLQRRGAGSVTLKAHAAANTTHHREHFLSKRRSTPHNQSRLYSPLLHLFIGPNDPLYLLLHLQLDHHHPALRRRFLLCSHQIRDSRNAPPSIRLLRLLTAEEDSHFPRCSSLAFAAERGSG